MFDCEAAVYLCGGPGLLPLLDRSPDRRPMAIFLRPLQGCAAFLIGEARVCAVQGQLARDRRAVLVVDGQQRCTTMMLLLAAVRDEARAADAARAEPLVAAVDAILLHRPKLRDNGATASGAAAEGRALRWQWCVWGILQRGVAVALLLALAAPGLALWMPLWVYVKRQERALLARGPRWNGAPPPPTGLLMKLKGLYLRHTQITNAGCATLAAALDSGALPALEHLHLECIPASAAAIAAVYKARANLKRW